MMRILWLKTVMVILVCLVLVTTGFAATLDTQGEGCGNMSCSVKSAALKSATPEKIVYDFEGSCGYWNASSVAACPPTVQVKATGEWFKNSKVAHEKIFKPIANTSSVILYSETSSNCPENPWLKAGVACNVVSGNTEPGVSYPRSAAVLSSAQRQYLASTQPPNSPILPTPQAPVIVLPTVNQKFVVIPANVKIQVKHDPNYGVNFEFQWKPFSKPNTPSGFFVTKKVTPTDLKTTYGVTSAAVKIDTKGFWRIRTQSIFPGAPWSNWTVFTVDALTLSPALKKQIDSVKPLN